MREDNEKKPASLESLNQQLEAVKKLIPESERGETPNRNGARAAIDFASATAVGTGLGYGLDVWQNTLPWGMLVGLFLGTAAGVKMVLQQFAHDAQDDADKTKND